MSFDAIIIGGSFAGLGVARQLRGDVLLIDRNEIGAGQTSACGTPLETVEAVGAEASVLQVHDRIVLHPSKEAVVEVRWRRPFCTFDYALFCQSIYKDLEVTFRKALVRGMENGRVITDAGEFRSRVIVDCSGWRRSAVGGPIDRGELGYGIETVLGHSEDGLHFYLGPEILEQGVGWVFPCGDKSRFGIASYEGQTRLKEDLDRFLERFRLRRGRLHGGFIPYALHPPTANGVFSVGDAAGQCPPLTCEGIRPALYFGTACGMIVQRVLEGELGLEEGLRSYRRFVRSHRIYYRILHWAQWVLPRLSSSPQARFWHLITSGWLGDYLTDAYLEMFRVDRVREASLPM